MMKHGSLAVGMTLALALAVTGCASKMRMTSARMCAAHGGTYNAATKSCTYTASTKSAAEVCQAQGGNYDTAADFCEFGLE